MDRVDDAKKKMWTTALIKARNVGVCKEDGGRA